MLEGSVRKAGNRVRITAQLIDGAAGDHVWADRYDRDLDDIFAIQDEISKAIVEALKIKLLPEEKKAIEQRGTNNAEAYNFYLMARQHWVSGIFGDPKRDEAIVRRCKQVTRLDPNYAEAWALMALAQARASLRPRQGRECAACRRAGARIELRASRSALHQGPLSRRGGPRRGSGAVKSARRCKLNPDSWEVNREAARMLFRMAALGEATEYFDKAASLMDTDWHNPLMLITCCNSIGDKDACSKRAKMTLERVGARHGERPDERPGAGFGANALDDPRRQRTGSRLEPRARCCSIPTI